MSEGATFSIRRSESYLMHYGVSGMKKGHRRYQDESGALTAEGREHYGIKERAKSAYGKVAAESNKPDSSKVFGKGTGTDTGLKKWMTHEGGSKAFANWREKRHGKNLEKATKKGNEKKIAKYESKLKAQSQANRDLENYRKNSSAVKLGVQNLAATTMGGHRYRHARARGSSRLTALIESSGGIIGTAARMHNDKKKYGKYIVYSALDEKMNDVLKT